LARASLAALVQAGQQLWMPASSSFCTLFLPFWPFSSYTAFLFTSLFSSLQ
jgi:hypothetical protein